MTPSPLPATPVRCAQLRCKAMLVFGEAFLEDPDVQAGVADYWCLATGQGLGPDGGPVELPACSDPKRACHQVG